MRWDPVTITWRLPSQELTPIYTDCDDAVCEVKGDQIEEIVYHAEYPSSSGSYTLRFDISFLVSILLFIIILQS